MRPPLAWSSTCRWRLEPAGLPASTLPCLLLAPSSPYDLAFLCPGQVYIEDSLGERIWVDSPHCRAFVDSIQTAFSTKMPPKSVLLQGEVGRSGGDLSAGETGY